MKVLFAVSSESISEAIVKKYQKEYKEILSYKNVYYFNAILKEIQKDKSYDRIVISEDLESFSNNNYEAIDKFIFDKLDNISDEAQDIDGNETSIILISGDRHTKGSAFLVKLFGIGIYNALLGTDRSMDNVCKLIKKPRVKKEAKIYYKIDSDDVNYTNKSSNEVSELEIQNILTHFKKLGRNTEKYAESFNSIANQYTDDQLKIVINCLPSNVKSVLEEDSKKYQELMSINGVIKKTANGEKKSKDARKQTGIKIDIIENKMNQNKISGPIVIPSSVRTSGKPSAKVSKEMKPITKTVDIAQVKNEPTKVKKKVIKKEEIKNMDSEKKSKTVKKSEIKTKVLPDGRVVRVRPKKSNTAVSNEEKKKVKIPEQKKPPVNEEKKKVKKTLEETQEEKVIKKPTKKRGRPKKKVELEDIEENIMLPGLEDDFEDIDIKEDILPGIEDDFEDMDVEEDVLPGIEDDFEDIDIKEDILPGIEDDFEDMDVEENVLPGMEDDFEDIDIDEDVLPGIEDDFEDIDVEEDILPGIEDDFEDMDIEEDILPGIEDDFEEIEEDEDVLPEIEDDFEEIEEDEDVLLEIEDDFEEIEEDEDVLPEIEDDFEEVEEDEDALLEIEDDFEEVEEDEDILPEIEDDDYTDEVDLPGLDDLDDLDDLGEKVKTDNASKIDKNIDAILPEIDEDDDILIGLDDEDEPTIEDQNQNTNIESIKPRIDYSMSSLNSLLTKDKKIVTFLGTTKNGTSFLINTLAALFSSLGINTAILDMTKNKNSYYIYTNNEEELRKIAYNSISKLQKGFAEGIKVNRNLTVYTALPNDGKDYSNAEPILSTLVQNHSLVLIDCDFETDPSYFASCQEIYLVQSMDILTIQPLTAFLRDLKSQGVLEAEKVRVVINKEIKVRSLTTKAIIGGMSFYNDPSMSFMTELFNKDMVKACSIPFEDDAYSKYLDSMVNCNVSINAYSKTFLSKLKNLGEMVYPLVSKPNYGTKSSQPQNYGNANFPNSMGNTLKKMKKNKGKNNF